MSDNWPNYPIPANMEGPRNPYSRRNTMFNPRLIASDVIMGLTPAPVQVADRLTGNRMRGQVDRFTGGEEARLQRDYDNYMREQFRQDSRATSQGSRTIAGLRQGWADLVQRFKDRFSRGGGEDSSSGTNRSRGLSKPSPTSSEPLPGPGGGRQNIGLPELLPGHLGLGVGRTGTGRGRSAGVQGQIRGPAAQAMVAGMQDSSYAAFRKGGQPGDLGTNDNAML